MGNQKGPVSRASSLFPTKVIGLRTAYKPFPATLILYFSPYIWLQWFNTFRIIYLLNLVTLAQINESVGVSERIDGN